MAGYDNWVYGRRVCCCDQHCLSESNTEFVECK